MHKALYPRDDLDRLYVLRKEGGRGLANIEDSVDASIQLGDYIEKHEGGLITAIKNVSFLMAVISHPSWQHDDQQKTITRKQKTIGKR